MRRVAAAAAALLLATAVPALADPTPSPTQEPESPIRVEVTTLLPRAPQRDDAFEVAGRLHNDGTQPISDLRVQLAIGDVVTNRGDLQRGDTDRPDTGRRTATRPVDGTLAPGASVAFSVRTTVADLGLTELGVYPLDVRSYGAVGDEGRSLLGLAPTWVPYFGRTNPQRNKVAVLLPLVDKPRQTPNGRLVDDELADLLDRDAEDGRLSRILGAARTASNPQCDRGPDTNAMVRTPGEKRCEPVPVTFGIDPDLISTVDFMANAESYEVGTGKPEKGRGKEAARDWLDRLKKQLDDGASVLALPYGDPDVDALARTAEGKEDIGHAVRLGNQVVTSALGTSPIDVLWPPAGVVTQDAGVALAPTKGVATFVLDESAYPDPDNEPSRDPSARTQPLFDLPGSSGLVADEGLSRLLVAKDETGHGSRLVEQRFIAETAILASQAQGASRTFLVVPPRDTDLSQAAAGESLRDLGRLPWLCPVRLSALAELGEDGKPGDERCTTGPTEVEATPAAPDEDVHTTLRTQVPRELPAGYLTGVYADRDAAHQLTSSVLDTDDPDTGPDVAVLRTRMRQAVARAQSTAWRDDPRTGQRMADALHEQVTQLTRSVQLLVGKRLLLTSNKGTLQVSVANSLDLPVRLRVQFTFPAVKPVSTGLLSIAPKRSVPASIKAEAQRSGQFLVLAQMYDRDGKPFGEQTQVLVRSTRYGRLALGVTFAAAGILFVAAGVRIVRRALTGREQT